MKKQKPPRSAATTVSGYKGKPVKIDLGFDETLAALVQVRPDKLEPVKKEKAKPSGPPGSGTLP